MRTFLAGFAALGLAATAVTGSANAAPAAAIQAVMPSGFHQVQMGECGHRCQEQRRIERERIHEHRRWEEHRLHEEHRPPPPPIGGYNRY